MGKYNIKFVREHIGKSLQTKFGGKVFSKQQKDILNPEKNPALKDKASGITAFAKRALKKVAFGKDSHSLTQQEMQSVLKTVKKIGATTADVKLTPYGRQASPGIASKRIQQEQLKADTPAGPTPQQLEEQQQLHERRMNVQRLYRQWDVEKEQGAVLGGRYLGRGNTTSVLERDEPVGSVADPQRHQAQTSAADSKQATTSASRPANKGQQPSVTGSQPPAESGKPPDRGAAPDGGKAGDQQPTADSGKPATETRPPSIMGGAPNSGTEKTDIAPVTEGTMQVTSTPPGKPSAKPTVSNEDKKKTKEERPDTSEVDLDLPLG